MNNDLTPQKGITLKDIQIPEGHVIVSTGGHASGAGFMDVAGEPSKFRFGEITPANIILNPEAFRVVPRSLVEEYAAMELRQHAEHEAFRALVDAMPQIHVAVSIS